MGKKLTTGERIRRYMEAHPAAKPKQIAEALNVSPTYVHTLRSTDKKKLAEGQPIRRIKRNYTKKAEPVVQHLGVTMAESDVAKLTPEQTERLVNNMKKPKARMQSSENLWQPPPVLPVPDAKSTLVHIGTFTSSKPIPRENFIDKTLKTHDNVNHPAHYKVGGIETIEFIEAKKLGYNLGNVVKYITRSDHKGNAYEDLCKARWYLNREISKYLGVANQ